MEPVLAEISLSIDGWVADDEAAMKGNGEWYESDINCTGFPNSSACDTLLPNIQWGIPDFVVGVAAHLRRRASTKSASSGCNPSKVADKVVGCQMAVKNGRNGGVLELILNLYIEYESSRKHMPFK